MSAVHEAWPETLGEPESGEPVALKIMHRELSSKPELVALLAGEAELLGSLDHPSYPRLIETGTLGDQPYIAMELVDGPPLNAVSTAELGPRARLERLRPIAVALDYLHDRGWVHCDVNPSNILIADRPVLVDLGVATRVESTQPQVRGTFAYMSPEQAKGELLDPRSDTFSFAIVLWELLAGRRLFRRSAPYLSLTAVARARAPSLDDPTLDAALRPALAKTKDTRPTHCLALVDAIAAAL